MKLMQDMDQEEAKELCAKIADAVESVPLPDDCTYFIQIFGPAINPIWRCVHNSDKQTAPAVAKHIDYSVEAMTNHEEKRNA